MHEFLHFIGICPDNITHINLIQLIASSYQNIPYINFKLILNYVTKRRPSH